MLQKRKNSENPAQQTNLKSIIKRSFVFKMFSKLLVFITMICLLMFCVLDYLNYDLYTLKYIFLYTSVLINLSCLLILLFT